MRNERRVVTMTVTVVVVVVVWWWEKESEKYSGSRCHLKGKTLQNAPKQSCFLNYFILKN
jgi:hypothetical protein